MRIGKVIITAMAVIAMAGSAQAVEIPTIGVYFDEEATQMTANVAGGPGQITTAYIFAIDANCPVGGMTFALDIDDAYWIMGAEYPDGVNIGTPKDGVAIGFTDCIPGFDGVPVLGAIITIFNGYDYVTDGELRVIANPREGGIYISDCLGELISATGLTSYMSVTVDNESVTWGQTKQLYR